MRSALAIFSLFLFCAVFCLQPAAGSVIDSIVDQASVSEFQSYIRVLTGVDPVPGSPGTYIHDRGSYGADVFEAAGYIHDQFTSYGLNTSYYEWDTGAGPNVIGELPGTTRPDDIYIVCGHYDAIDEMPGCDDNASGTASVMMAARIFSQYQFEGTIRFIAFSGEEIGLFGSQFYAFDAWWAEENIEAVINYDMFLHPSFDNIDPDPDYDLEVSHDGTSAWLADLMAQQMALHAPGIDVETYYDDLPPSDNLAFSILGYSAIGIHENMPDEIYGGSNDVYHGPGDTIDNPDLDWEFGLGAMQGGYGALATLATPIPEPGTLMLIVIGGLLLMRRRRG